MKLSNEVYDVLSVIAGKLPLLATFYCAIAKLWDLPLAAKISGTILALAALLNGFLERSSTEYYKDIASAKEYFDESGEEEKAM